MGLRRGAAGRARLGRKVERRAPDLITTTWWRKDRDPAMLFVDYSKNARDHTIASVRSVRSMPEVTVSTPISWESLRLASEHAKWLRDERQKSYAGLSLAGEDVLQFIRSEMPMLIGPSGADRREATAARWIELRTELRKAYNQVALFGADDARAMVRQVWRISRNGGNDFLRDLESHPDNAADRPDLSEQLKDVASHLGTASDRFLEACRAVLQGG